MPEETLILKRNPDARYTESYNILFEGRHVGRIYKAVSHAPREAPWFWGLDFRSGLLCLHWPKIGSQGRANAAEQIPLPVRRPQCGAGFGAGDRLGE